MWNLYLLAMEFHSRPSAVLGIDDEWAAYQFDMACLRLARYVDAELEKKRTLNAILSEDLTTGHSPTRAGGQTFSDVRQIFQARSMSVPESGVW